MRGMEFNLEMRDRVNKSCNIYGNNVNMEIVPDARQRLGFAEKCDIDQRVPRAFRRSTDFNRIPASCSQQSG